MGFSLFFFVMILLSSAYLAPIHYYCYLYHFTSIMEERCDHYVKQTYRNRCLIAGGDGVQALTIPVEGKSKTEGGASKTAMKDIRLSEHGRWREHHWNALVTAYESTPYFEYYAPELRAIYEAPFTHLVEFNAALQNLVLDFLQLQPNIVYNSTQYIDLTSDNQASYLDLREWIRPKISPTWDSAFVPQPYYQVFQARHGFIANLSIVDALFNLGPETRLLLRDSWQTK